MAKARYKQPTLFQLPELQEYLVLMAPSGEVKSETKKLQNKLYKIIGRKTENEYAIPHISLFKTRYEKDAHVLEKSKKALADAEIKRFNIKL